MADNAIQIKPGDPKETEMTLWDLYAMFTLASGSDEMPVSTATKKAAEVADKMLEMRENAKDL